MCELIPITIHYLIFNKELPNGDVHFKNRIVYFEHMISTRQDYHAFQFTYTLNKAELDNNEISVNVTLGIIFSI